MPVGTVAILAWLVRRHRRVALALGALLAVQAIGWAAVWGPHTVSQWIRVSGPEAATLASGDRDTDPATSMAFVGELAGPLHATLVTHANGVWAFRLNPPPGVHSITLPGSSSALPAWTAPGAAGVPALSGALSSWHMAATGARGYVADGLEWLEAPGRYNAEVTLSSTGPVNVEVWDDNTSVLLARRTIPSTGGSQQLALPVTAPDARTPAVYSGWGPFRAVYEPAPAGQRIEVRVWSPGGSAVSVYSADLTADPGSALRP